jgi:transcriptional regulator with XRE-family HTH domain
VSDEERKSSRPERPDGFHELRRIVAANIRNERHRRGWSLDRVAAGLAPYLGQMGASTISAWENSRHDGAKGFTVEEVYGLCRTFDIDLAELFAPPVLLDMAPIEKLPGEEPLVYLALTLRGFTTDLIPLSDRWQRYADEIGVIFDESHLPPADKNSDAVGS